MRFAPGVHNYMPPPMLSSYSPEALRGFAPAVMAYSSGTWALSNRIVYVPFALNRAVTVYKLWWANGATVGTNNLQAAVYDSAFGRLINGASTLSAGANACQYNDITDAALGPGRYYMALWCNGTTATTLRSTTTQIVGAFYETHASGPQATGTPVSPGVTAPVIPLFGLQLRSSP